MTKSLDDLLPSADEVMKKIALAESEKAAEAFRKHAAEEAQKWRKSSALPDRQA